jgi:hypothetical protein
LSKRNPDLDFRGDLQIEVMNAVWPRAPDVASSV